MRSYKTLSLTSVLTAGCLMSACGDSFKGITTPSSPGSADVRSSSPHGQNAPLPSPMPPGSASCDSTKARGEIGKRASDALLERARLAAGAASARYLRPDDRITLEYLDSRLNLVLDARDFVRSVVCG